MPEPPGYGTLGSGLYAMSVTEQYLLITNPPHGTVNEDSAAKALAWTVAELRMRLHHPAPEIWVASTDHDGVLRLAKQLVAAGLSVGIIRGAVLAAVPVPEPVTAISLSDAGFVATAQSGELAIPHDAQVVAVVAQPRRDSQEVLRAGEGGAPSGIFADLYVLEGKRWRAGRVDPTHVAFAGLGKAKQPTTAGNMRVVLDELRNKFSDCRVDERLVNVNYRFTTVSGRTMPHLLHEISPDLGHHGRFDLASRLVFLSTFQKRPP